MRDRVPAQRVAHVGHGAGRGHHTREYAEHGGGAEYAGPRDHRGDPGRQGTAGWSDIDVALKENASSAPQRGQTGEEASSA